MAKFWGPLAVIGVVVTWRTSELAAATVAGDIASNPPYALEFGGAWKGLNPTPDENPAGNDDGGVGFNPWSFAGGFHYSQQSPYGRMNHFIDGIDFAPSSYNSLGAPAFALTNANVFNGGATSAATRAFDAPLAVGDTLSLKFDNPSLASLGPNDEAGFVIRLNAGGGPLSQSGVKERFAIFATSNFLDGNWVAADSAGDNSLGLSTSATRSAAEFRFMLTGTESYRLDILLLAGGAPLATKTGNLARPGTGAIDAIEVLMYGNGSGNGLTGAAGQRTGEREFFFNNLSVTTASSSTAGDYDSDGDVDGADFLQWQRDFNSDNLRSDGNNNGVVDGGDLQIWRSAFGAGGRSIAVSVPEPHLFPLLVGFVVFCARRMRAAAS